MANGNGRKTCIRVGLTCAALAVFALALALISGVTGNMDSAVVLTLAFWILLIGVVGAGIYFAIREARLGE